MKKKKGNRTFQGRSQPHTDVAKCPTFDPFITSCRPTGNFEENPPKLRSFSRKMHSQTQSKFRGCLLGSLMGDCLGAPYEGQEITSGDKIIIQRYFDKMEDPSFKGPFKKYTDDTAMMRSVANFLLDRPDPDMKHLARLFVTEFCKQPGRGYGQNVVEVFEKLKDTRYKDVFKPATEQFNGSGSYGNGGAMRIAPIPLFFHDNFDAMLKVAEESTKITHTNLLGINGALLQCLAIHQAFLADASSPVDVQSFCTELLKKVKKIEDDAYEVEDQSETPFCSKLKQVQSLLKKKPCDDLDEEVIYILGHGISAYESVATAIYCFLRAQTDIPGIQTSDQLRRTLQYAITLGGDTDTIACMAGAIVGAHLGEGAINRNLLQHCEKHGQIEELADKLFEATSGS